MKDRDQFIEILGGSRERPGVDIRTKSVVQREGYARHHVDYAVTLEERIEAFLLVPDDVSQPLPCIVAIHQDGGGRPYQFGKSEVAGLGGDPSLAYGAELCRRGYIVICPDRFGFESRSLANSGYASQFAEFPIKGSVNDVDYTEDLYKGASANRLIWNGWSALGKELHELQCAIDCLESLSMCDTERIGAIGHSAGGLLTPYLMFVDDRVKAGISSCGTWLLATAFQTSELRPMQGFGGLLTIPGMAQWGDTDDILEGIAPRPFFEAREDYFSEAELDLLYGKAKRRYLEIDLSNAFMVTIHESGHTFPTEYRAQAYDWFDHWMGKQV